MGTILALSSTSTSLSPMRTVQGCSSVPRGYPRGLTSTLGGAQSGSRKLPVASTRLAIWSRTSVWLRALSPNRITRSGKLTFLIWLLWIGFQGTECHDFQIRMLRMYSALTLFLFHLLKGHGNSSLETWRFRCSRCLPSVRTQEPNEPQTLPCAYQDGQNPHGYGHSTRKQDSWYRCVQNVELWIEYQMLGQFVG